MFRRVAGHLHDANRRIYRFSKNGGILMKTFMASPATIDRKWYVVDATDMTLGRLASEVAKVLRGKNKPIFTPHMDTGAESQYISYTHLLCRA